MPSLTGNNLQQSLDFFTGLGFDVEDRWEQNGTLVGVMIKAGQAWAVILCTCPPT
jgi:hypothetical protein